ncbi:MAG: amino acid adenylation domain-containing protein [Cyanobacteria bacterium P01_H01_bin.150]
MQITQIQQQEIAQKLTKLSDKKRLAFIDLLRKEGIDSLKLPIVPAIRQSNNLPLSWAQERMWFFEQLEGSSATYNIPAAFSVSGNLNINTLEQTLSEIVRRHEVLRTTFQTQDNEAVQVIHPEVTTNINVVDLQEYSESEHQTLVRELAQKEADTPFNLEVAPLIRCSLLKLDTTEYVLLLTMHHIVSDGWSMGVLVKEICTIYQSFSAAEPSPLAELPIQYGDFAIWQKQWLSGEVLDNQLNYWKQQLKDAPDLLQLPTDYQRPSVKSYQGALKHRTLNVELTQKLQNLSRKSGTTLFMTLLAGFATLLYRYTSQKDILIGSAIANRNRSEIESLIGFFVNTLVMRTGFEDNPSFESLLEEVKKTTFKAYENQDVPFEQVVEALQPQRSLAYSPLIQVMFDLQMQNSSEDTIELPGVTFSGLNQDRKNAKFDLTLLMRETGEELVCEWEYSTDLFDDSTIERIAAHFENLLSAIVENPSQKVGSLPLLSEAEFEQLLVSPNDVQNQYPVAKCIHQLFEEQVEKNPDAVAVVFEEEQLTYKQLNQKANQLARHLQSLGVGSEVLVGICVERSIEMIVGILGILKAGGAYVPLDPNYLQERLSYMLSDSGVKVLLTQEQLLESLPENQATTVCLDKDWELIEQQSQENLNVELSPNNLAYIIYTSGSTGKPKGVLIEHKNVIRLFAASQSWYNFNSNDVWTNFHSIAFDFSVWEIWGALLHGASLVVVPYWVSRDTQAFYELLCSQNVTVLNQTPSAFRQLIAVEKPDDGQLELSLRLVIFGGEALDLQSLKPWFDRYGDKQPQLVNMYGITETTVHVTYRPLTIQDLDCVSSMIGCPIPDLQMYILDDNLQPVPTGVRGEMYIGGSGLARGYLNREQLTSQRFIPNPFDSKQESRLYKTGDLARYVANGDVEYLGRIDNQVKIRGFRIELGEIEAVLSGYPQIQQVVVLVREDAGTKRLIAYVATKDESLTSKQLNEFLKSKLPEYMVPSAFVILETLPLTSNGKVDRKTLQATDVESEIIRTEEYVAPSTEIEKTLANIWQELLPIEKVSINDNLFEIGGDSILSIQVVSRAKNAGIQISAKQIFLHQTIAELAQVAGTEITIECNQGIVTGVAPLTPIQKWFLADNNPESHHYNQSVLLQVPGDVKPELIETAIQELVSHHDALRLRFTAEASQYKQTNHDLDDNVPFNVVDLSSTPKQEQSQQIEKLATEFQGSLNIATGPIMQVVLFNLGENQDARLLIIIHHLAVDGVSWRILLSDLQTIYQQIIAKQPIQFEPKTTAFIDWSTKLNNYAQSEKIKQELDYWNNQPWDSIKPLPLDYANNKQENTVTNTASVSVKLSQEKTRALLGSVNEAYNTQINDILLSALAVSCSGWTGNSTIAIDLEGHGREELFDNVDLSRTVGWFTSLFPVLLQLPKHYQISNVIKSIKEQLRAIPNRGIGYGVLRYLSSDDAITEQLKAIPTPEISFNYLGQFDQVESESEWKLATESPGNEHSPNLNCKHLLDINALVVEGSLQINWTYSTKIHNRETVDNLAQSYIQAIESIVEHCQLAETFGYTPSDFPDANLTQLELDELLAPIATKNVADIYPLSPMQKGMLFHSLYAPESGMYFEQTVFDFQGQLNIPAFTSAWQKVVDRYSVFRTFFVWENRQNPLQVVLKQVKLPFENIDWQEFSDTEQQQKLESLLQTQKSQGFQFNQAPLTECTLIQLDEDTYKFIWNHHHILMDGWCLSIIFKEVVSFYEASIAGETCYLPTPRPYGDYISWLNEQDNVAAKSFWQQTLQGFSSPTPLVVDKKQPQIETSPSNYQQLELRLSSEISSKLQDLAQQHHVTLSTLVQAAWGTLLSRYSGESDVLFGVTVSGRPGDLSRVEEMVGLFINTLPLRLQISPQEELIPWLQKIQQLMLELQDYSYTPLVEIQSGSEIPAQTPLFESLVVFENYPIDSTLSNQVGCLQLNNVETFERTNYPLTLVAVPGSEFLFNISYDTVRFEEDTIKRMLGHLQTIFAEIVDNPERKVTEVPLLSEAERYQILTEWNDTTTDYPKDKCIHQLFEEQVEKTPDTVAVVFEGEQLTYKQLNQKANQLARHLQSLGVKPEVLVGICVERSIEMLVGLLGILKAGGAYVPFDPSYPQERLSYMLSDSQLPILLTQQHLLKQLPKNQTQTICLDRDWQNFVNYCEDNPISQVKSNNLAYIIYTSGSTGKPKGTMILHSGMVNYLSWCTKAYNVADGVGSTVNSSIGFDATITSLFSPLLVGGKVVLLPQEEEIEALKAALCSGTKFSLVKITPAHLEILSHLLKKEAINIQTQAFIIGGEALSEKVTSFWQKNAPKIKLINEYGPTETVVGCCIYSVVEQSFPGGNIPIGRPISNTQLYILDQYGQPVPIGVPGELYIGGEGVARGYLNRPELTSERFIQNPFDGSKSQRLYKTGDLARYRDDGNIEYIGRIDNQVKVRGFRIELGEIEAIINAHPQVKQAVVIVKEDINNDKRLVAYVIFEELTTAKELREYLKSQLPEYMVPSAFVTLDTLPLTPNGKVDRKALQTADTDADTIERENEYVAPRTESEETIANIFAEVLSVKNVGIHDNFFSLGGHSLLATQLISKLRVAFSSEIPLRTVFESPTVAELEPILTKTSASNKGLTLPQIQPRTEGEELPLSWSQERLWFLNELEDSSSTYNIPGAISINGNLDIAPLSQAVSEIVRRHEVLRTSFQTKDGKAIQVIHPPMTMNLDVVDLQVYDQTERYTLLKQQAQLEADTPFNLEIAPLIRCQLLQLDTTEYVLLITMHHIVSDGWSTGVFIKELSSLYQAFSKGEPSPLPELPIQYGDFAIWQRQWLSGEVLENQLNYWVSELEDAPELLQLPTDYPRPSVQSYQGATQKWTLNTELTQQIKNLSRKSGTTLFMTLLAGFATLLHRYTNQEDILIGSSIANRNRSEIESLIGFFVNNLVLRTHLEDNPSFENLLQQVKETTLKAYEHQDVPFEQIVEAVQPQRSLAYSPLFQVMFDLHNAPETKVELPDLTLGEINQESAIAKFDLTVSVTETDQELVCEWEYNTDLFDSSTIERMAAHYQNLLSAIVENPQQMVSELPLLSQAERQQLLVEWNNTAVEYPTHKSIHQLFEEQVEKNGNAIAVKFAGEQLTYLELNQKANQLAHHLQSLGVGKETLVGVCLERSIEMVIGILAILKAGGAYVPLDPNYPQERLNYIVNDADVEIVITKTSLIYRLPNNQTKLVLIDDNQFSSTANLSNPVNTTKPKNLAYVIYTSGSTGKPKATMIEHRGCVNHCYAMIDNLDLKETDTIAQTAPIGFDISVWQILTMLLIGGKVSILKNEIIQEPAKFFEEIETQEITVVQVVPSLLATMLDICEQSEAPKLSHLRWLSVTGEAFTANLMDWWFKYYPSIPLLNAYGPAECSDDVTLYPVYYSEIV